MADKKTEVQKLNDAIDRKIESETIRSQLIADRLFNKVNSLPSAKRTYTPKQSKKSINEEVCLILSDLHLGYEFTLEETGGICEYNYEIFKKRLNTLKQNVTEKLELHIPQYKKKVLNVFILGDIVSGTPLAGAWEAAYTDMPIKDQVMKGFDNISSFVYYYSTMFDQINLYCVRGNHGRTERQKIEKDYCNWDNICYEFIKLRFKEVDNINVHTADSFFQTANINGYNFLVLHGDKISGSTSLSKLEDAQLRVSAMKREFYDYVLSGHYHVGQESSTVLGKVIVNGSFLGGDIYSVQSLQQSRRPEQKLFGVNKKEGISWQYDIPLVAS